jgi:hypothetical protein
VLEQEALAAVDERGGGGANAVVGAAARREVELACLPGNASVGDVLDERRDQLPGQRRSEELGFCEDVAGVRLRCCSRVPFGELALELAVGQLLEGHRGGLRGGPRDETLERAASFRFRADHGAEDPDDDRAVRLGGGR